MIEKKERRDSNGYIWVPDPRNEDYFYLKDFEHLIVMKVTNFSESLPLEHWEALVFEDETCKKVIGRQEYATMREAQDCLEHLVEISLKNRKLSKSLRIPNKMKNQI